MSGFNVAEASAHAAYVRAQGAEADALAALPPYRALPMQALDHAAGYFLAFGIAAALCRTITVSGLRMPGTYAYGRMTDPMCAGGRQLGGACIARRDDALD